MLCVVPDVGHGLSAVVIQVSVEDTLSVCLCVNLSVFTCVCVSMC